MRAVLVSHTHWDREWYRTFQAFRARLVDTVDRVLDLLAADPGFCFVLDGQAVVLEDYAEIRPTRVEELRQRCVEGRLAIGPWYVQPDSLLPSGEAHLRNLLEGRRASAQFGPVSNLAYTPDSFGHPAQFPQLFAGFGLEAFVYWRGNGGEWDRLPAEYDWVAPDGTTLLACHLGRGYFSAASDVGSELTGIVTAVAETAKALADRTRSGVILLMNGIDHHPPDPRTSELARELGAVTGLDVRRGLIDEFVAEVRQAEIARPRYEGELVGARVAPLLPGVWSTRSWIKLANRAAESALEGWAEPWVAFGTQLGLPDERPALRLAWRSLLVNQAHDSICGCSRDEVHEQMRSRFDTAREIAEETTTRALERIAGLDPLRRPPWDDELELAVFNPSPHPRTDVVRFVFDPHPYIVPSPDPARMIHPTRLLDLDGAAYTVDGSPARFTPVDEPGGVVLLPDRRTHALEFVARDVPAFGWKRVRVRRAEDPDACAEQRDPALPGSPDAVIEADDVRVALSADGTFDVALGGRTFAGLGALVSEGDRGDSYDFDPVPGDVRGAVVVRAERRTHPSGLQELVVDRVLRVPAGLAEDRDRRGDSRVELPVRTWLRVAPGVQRIDLTIRVDNTARDHRLRIGFPVENGAVCHAATTFDVVRRSENPVDDSQWVQKAPRTFVHQGFVQAGGLCVGAPGLAEAEWDGRRISLTLLRAVGFLSRHDLHSRPGPAGPGTRTPSAQCPGPLEARIFLLPGLDPGAVRAAELGLQAVPAGPEPLVPPGEPLLELSPRSLQLSALKPAEDGGGWILRVANPTGEPHEMQIQLGRALRGGVAEARPVRLDETPIGPSLPVERGVLSSVVPAHALRTFRLR